MATVEHCLFYDIYLLKKLIGKQVHLKGDFAVKMG